MPSLQIGVMLESVQLSDIVCIDILGNLSTEYIKSSSEMLPAHLHDSGTDITFHYIATTLAPAGMTPSIKFLPTVTYDEAPRDLDILIIGGPPLTHRPAAADKFMKEAAKQTKLIMTTCVGGLWLASAGVLDGKKATTNREALAIAKQINPLVQWEDKRWVVDGKFWTAGGAGAGIDMVAEYAKQNFNKELVQRMLQLLEFNTGVTGQYYKD